MTGMTKPDNLIHTTIWPSGELEIPNGKGSEKTVLANYSKKDLQQL